MSKHQIIFSKSNKIKELQKFAVDLGSTESSGLLKQELIKEIFEIQAKKNGNIYGKVIEYTRTENGTSIGRRPKLSSMNKNKRRSFKKYRGQGK